MGKTEVFREMGERCIFEREMTFLKKTRKLRRWEMAVLVGVAATALAGSWLGMEQDRLAEEVLRLHVVANSDSAEDQALKYEVRDEVLAVTEPLLTGLDRKAALKALEGSLEEIAHAAEDVVARSGKEQRVTVRLAEGVWFPTKKYENFALPAGEYTALRVELGEGKGQNWWCVVFPPLCLGSVSDVSEEAMAAGVSGESVALMTGETEGYVVKFKLIELWEELKEGLR